MLVIIIIIRLYESSWASPSGVILMGDYDRPKTTEKILQDGSTTASFDLKYSTS